ncbi:MAG: DUF3037 domain-containing protein [Spirochaetia bacterium]|nr:DUF3037 domain-containing protein [Spirochaetia bacterium]
MPEKKLFEYAVLRVVPRVEREEFINVGVVLYCAGNRFLKTFFYLDEKRLTAFAAGLDLAELRKHLEAFGKISAGDPDGGPIAALDAASRFRWLTATRSTVVQTSKIHPGLCDDPETALENLVKELSSGPGP